MAKEILSMKSENHEGNFRKALQLEAVVKLERLDLYNQEKPFGAKAVRRHLEGIGIKNLPSERTIGRILEKQGLTCKTAKKDPGDFY